MCNLSLFMLRIVSFFLSESISPVISHVYDRLLYMTIADRMGERAERSHRTMSVSDVIT